MRLLQRMGGSEYVVARMQELQLGKLLGGFQHLLVYTWVYRMGDGWKMVSIN